MDFLVLAKGKYFVGFGSSTFSFYLREHRVLQVPSLLMCVIERRIAVHERRSPIALYPHRLSWHSQTSTICSMQGMQRSSSVLVDASVIGTDPLFNSAGTCA